jgi:hypothetical protein
LARNRRTAGSDPTGSWAFTNCHPKNPNGRIRVEAYTRALTGGQTPPAVVGLPAANGELNQAGAPSIVRQAPERCKRPRSTASNWRFHLVEFERSGFGRSASVCPAFDGVSPGI